MAGAIVEAALGTRFTGAVLRVERGGRALFEAAYGTLDDAPGARRVEVTTPFDLASLTKVVVATSVLQGVAAGFVALDAPASRWLTEWRGTGHAAITPRMLLAHTSGMQSGADYRTLTEENVERFALRRPLAAPPGQQVIYSDLGFIALGTLLARACGRALPSVVRRTTQRLDCEATGYRARNERPDDVPATEEDGWRGRVRGAVHDEKAYLLNGVAGHAGLFGTARDIARVAEVYLGARRRPAASLPAALALEAIAEHGSDPVLRRGLGWALKTSDANSCGAAMDVATFGHTGFTGTSVWADPERDLCVVLLTNAVYFGRRDLRDVRAAVCDACVAEFGSCARSA